jgi:hypothetical protein
MLRSHIGQMQRGSNLRPSPDERREFGFGMVDSTLVGVRLRADQIKAIDAWAVKQNPPVTRPEAMLQILSKDRERSHPRRRTGNEMMATDQPDSPLAGLS